MIDSASLPITPAMQEARLEFAKVVGLCKIDKDDRALGLTWVVMGPICPWCAEPIWTRVTLDDREFRNIQTIDGRVRYTIAKFGERALAMRDELRAHYAAHVNEVKP